MWSFAFAAGGQWRAKSRCPEKPSLLVRQKHPTSFCIKLHGRPHLMLRCALWPKAPRSMTGKLM